MKTKYVALVAAAALGLSLVAVPSAAEATVHTGTVVLQVTSPNGVPLATAGFQVELYSTSSSSSYDVTQPTGGAGNATFTSVPSNIRLTAVLDDQGLIMWTHKTGQIVATGHVLTVKLPAIQGATIAGNVTEYGSGAIAGADVSVYNSHGTFIADGTTNGSGDYVIGPLKTGSYHVQFNSRIEGPTTQTQNDPWSYWPGTTSWAHSGSIAVRQQSATRAATARAGVNGVVEALYSITAQVNDFPAGYSGETLFVRSSHLADNFNDVLNVAGDGWSAFMNPGSYKFGILGKIDIITGDVPVYWYTGDSTAPTTNYAHAKAVNFTDTHNVFIQFNISSAS